jgi:hypothetical protein
MIDSVDLVPVVDVDLGVDDTISLARSSKNGRRLLPEQRPVGLLGAYFQ